MCLFPRLFLFSDEFWVLNGNHLNICIIFDGYEHFYHSRFHPFRIFFLQTTHILRFRWEKMFVAHDKNHSSMHNYSNSHTHIMTSQRTILSEFEVSQTSTTHYDSSNIIIPKCGAYKIPFNGFECEMRF